MRCETWMDDEPPKRDPLIEARRVLNYWTDRKRGEEIRMKSLILGVSCWMLALWAAGYHIAWKPTPDQLYGCTLSRQLPNGDCP